MIAEINTIADVEAFAHQLVAEGLTGGFHPDDPSEDYTDASGQPLNSTKEAALRNALVEQCFDVCGDDVYAVTGRTMLRDTPFASISDSDHENRYNEFMTRNSIPVGKGISASVVVSA